jgi:hypothetical protein
MKNAFKLILLFSIFCNLPLQAFSQKQSWDYSKSAKYSLPKWEVGDIVFRLRNTPPDNPFDLVFGAQIQGPGNISFNVPGFYK